MKYIILYTLRADGVYGESARCELRNEEVVCSGDGPLVENLERYGVGVMGNDTETIFPKDGLRFLEAAHKHFTSEYLMTSDILET